MLKTLTMREADEGDAVQIANLHKRVIREIHAESYPTQRIEQWVHGISLLTIKEEMKKDHFIVEVKDKASIVAFVHFENTGHIFQIYVEPLYSGKGVGSSLLNEAERLMLTKHMKEISVLASENSVQFFKHRGYAVNKKMYVSMTKIPLFEMKKRLIS